MKPTTPLDTDIAAILGPSFTGPLDPLLRRMALAENEIDAAKKRHPEHAMALHDAFLALQPSDVILRSGPDKLYPLHCHELLERAVHAVHLSGWREEQLRIQVERWMFTAMAVPSLPEREHWETVFREKHEDEVSWFQERAAISLQLIANTGVAKTASIVDVGAGASRLVDGLLAAGYRDLLVVDLAEAALAKARARLKERASEVRWLVRDVTTWVPEERFDVWHDRALFHFMVHPEDREAYLTTLRRALSVGGHAIFATFASDGPESCSGMPVQRYEPETLAQALGADFHLVESVRDAHVTPANKVQSFQYSRFERVR
ncbi:MAG: class I SAM-dependent methyltransferase [Myxococcales bacterium]|jgi:2-polyprenyl-3-methyl-5-hydroxy-6-metoxy-1,4-benzoquinol methylase|nr:class I SAM-dependent methyltransferase [Myxococcales bacterium]